MRNINIKYCYYYYIIIIIIIIIIKYVEPIESVESQKIFFRWVYINYMSLVVWFGENRKCSAAACGRFRFGVKVIYGTAVFIKSIF